MQPQETNTQEPADFGFMLNQQQQAKKSPAGRFANLGKPAKILVAAAVGLVIAIAAAMILGGGDDNSKQVVSLMAQSQEIVRVSQSQDQKFRDADTKGLSATTQASLNSQKFQLGDYLSKAGAKYSPQELAAKMNAQTDTELQTAAQNNNLDAAFVEYLKTSLTAYQNSLNETANAVSSQTLKSTLQSASNSVQTLLNSPQFTNS